MKYVVFITALVGCSLSAMNQSNKQASCKRPGKRYLFESPAGKAESVQNHFFTHRIFVKLENPRFSPIERAMLFALAAEINRNIEAEYFPKTRFVALDFDSSPDEKDNKDDFLSKAESALRAKGMETVRPEAILWPK